MNQLTAIPLVTLVALAAFIAAESRTPCNAETALHAYIGTYTRGASQGIYRLRVVIEGQSVRGEAGLAAETRNPSFLAAHPNGKWLFAVGEIDAFRGRPSGKLVAYRRGADGALAELSTQATEGGAPCYVSLDATGRTLLVANYGSGTVASFPVTPAGEIEPAMSHHRHEGRSVITSRQAGPHAHCVITDPTNRFVLASDLGADRVFVYRFDESTGGLTPHEPPSFAMPPGSGPRHLAFHPAGRILIVINELSSTIASLRWDPDAGALALVNTESTLPADFDSENSCADVHVHPTGRWVYGSNRGHDSIALFDVDGESGELTPRSIVPARVKTPRNFGIDPSGRYLLACGQDSSTIGVFRIDQTTGGLEAIGEPIDAPTPVCVKFVNE